MSFFSKMNKFFNIRRSVVGSLALGVSVQNFYSQNKNKNVIEEIVHLRQLEKSVSISSNIESNCVNPGPYPNWTLKDIHDYPVNVSRTLLHGARLGFNNKVVLEDFDKSEKELLNIENALLFGENKNILSFGVKLMNHLSSFKNVVCVDDINQLANKNFGPNIGLCYVSSGQEAKQDNVISALKSSNPGMVKFSISNNKINEFDTTLENDLSLNMYSGKRSFLSKVTAMTLISLWFSQKRNNKSNDSDIRVKQAVDSLHCLPSFCGITLNSKTKCKEIAKQIYKNKKICIFGKGFGEPIAHESAQELNEITKGIYHCKGVNEFEDIEMIEKNTIIMIVLNDEHLTKMKQYVNKIISNQDVNNMDLIIITDVPQVFDDKNNKKVITIPSNKCLTSPLALIPISLIGYEMAIKLGINPDKN